MALDSRDCRLDIILGDDAVPDDVSLPFDNRDSTCGWCDFIDNQLNPSINQFNQTDTEKVTTSNYYQNNKNTIIVSKK